MTHLQKQDTFRNTLFSRKTAQWLLPLILCLITIASAQAQTLHALIVIMDANQHVGKAVKINGQAIEDLLTEVDKHTELHLEKQTFLSSRHHARAETLMKWLNTRQIDDDDVLFIYFSGIPGFGGGEELLYLQDGAIAGKDLAQTIQKSGNCRLKMLITDRCNASLMVSIPPPQTNQAPAARLKNLFEKHTGFLHLTSTTGKEPGWTDPKIGGLFTHAFLNTMRRNPVLNQPTFTTWKDVFQHTQQTVKATFKRGYTHLPDAIKIDLRNRGIDNQIPQAYQLPAFTGTQETDKPPKLWALENYAPEFAVNLKTHQTDYRINEKLTFEVEVTEKTYIFILNWDENGNFAILFPNRLEDDNLRRPGKKHIIPQKDARFNLPILGPPGTERIKIFALRNATDNNQMKQLAATLIGAKEPQKHGSTRIETRILQYLQRMTPADWAENSIKFQVHPSREKNNN